MRIYQKCVYINSWKLKYLNFLHKTIWPNETQRVNFKKYKELKTSLKICISIQRYLKLLFCIRFKFFKIVRVNLFRKQICFDLSWSWIIFKHVTSNQVKNIGCYFSCSIISNAVLSRHLKENVFQILLYDERN